MTTLAHQAETLKLARLLHTAPEQLDFVGRLDAAEVRALRERATAALFDGDRHLFHRVAAATKLLPAPIAALIAEKALGPLLCARVAGLLPPERAVDIAKRLHTRFLADVCLELDPRHVRELIAQMPVKRIVEVAHELAARREYITMARFVDVLPEAAMRATLDALQDDETLLRIGFFVENPAQLSAVIQMLSEHRLSRLIRVSVEGAAELWGEALALINAIDAPQRRLMAGLAAALDAPVLERMIGLTHEAELWTALLPVVAEMDDAARARLTRLQSLNEDAVLAAMLRAVDAANLWPQLLPLVSRMDATLQQRAVRVAEQQDAALLQRLDQALRRLAAGA
ncbi:hypothetical protein AAG565_13070 [Fontimonas sp. SYSU GA230001]|uniref:hypothetical protein n=1 Tax=Fontimonas sp. SYSU GA230001 TaxID=3142450 RepID=UPI0032B3AD5D